MRSEWELPWRLGLALVLSTAIGLERELRQKSAGLRTYTLVGLGSALFLLVSDYGFFDELPEGQVVLDPSRVAAQIVSGIGFIGGGPAVLVIASTLVTTTHPPAPGLREVLSRVTGAGFDVSRLNFQRHDEDAVVVDGVLLVNAADSDPD